MLFVTSDSGDFSTINSNLNSAIRGTENAGGFMPLLGWIGLFGRCHLNVSIGHYGTASPVDILDAGWLLGPSNPTRGAVKY